jgi:hypothetical protein
MGADALAETSNGAEPAEKNKDEAFGADARAGASSDTVCGDDLQLLSCHDSYIYVSYGWHLELPAV